MDHCADLESGHHLPLFLAVEEVVVVLHGDEGSKVVRDCVIYRVQCISTTKYIAPKKTPHFASIGLHLQKNSGVSQGEYSLPQNWRTHIARHSTRSCLCTGRIPPSRHHGELASRTESVRSGFMANIRSASLCVRG